MKVSKVGGAKSADSAKKTKKSADDGAFADALKGAVGPSAAEAAKETSGIGGVESILAIQQTADATDHRSRGLMMDHGNDLLDRLDQLRGNILLGAVPKDRLKELAQSLRARKIKSDDPRLNDLIDEIELRVEVEIAKLTR